MTRLGRNIRNNKNYEILWHTCYNKTVLMLYLPIPPESLSSKVRPVWYWYFYGGPEFGGQVQQTVPVLGGLVHITTNMIRAVPTIIIFGKMRFLLVSKNEFFFF